MSIDVFPHGIRNSEVGSQTTQLRILNKVSGLLPGGGQAIQDQEVQFVEPSGQFVKDSIFLVKKNAPIPEDCHGNSNRILQWKSLAPLCN